KYEFTQPIEMRFNELIAGVRGDLAVKIYGDEFPVMEKLGNQIAQILNKIPGAADVKVAQTEGQPLIDIQIDEEAISRLGLNRKEISEMISTAIGGRKTGVILEGDRRFDI